MLSEKSLFFYRSDYTGETQTWNQIVGSTQQQEHFVQAMMRYGKGGGGLIGERVAGEKVHYLSTHTRLAQPLPRQSPPLYPNWFNYSDLHWPEVDGEEGAGGVKEERKLAAT